MGFNSAFKGLILYKNNIRKNLAEMGWNYADGFGQALTESNCGLLRTQRKNFRFYNRRGTSLRGEKNHTEVQIALFRLVSPEIYPR